MNVRARFVSALVVTAWAVGLPAQAEEKGQGEMPTAPGPFQPTWDSLEQYKCPEWFRDAKFGIWAHWSAQCVPEQGDWYARRMYTEGDSAYKFHVDNYGHPSKVGFKDICNMWKAEKWDPDKLIELYKRAGAKYFVALANHHCNFDCWDSKYQPWNSVNIGPKKDIVGTWAKVARKHGLRFGVTVHNARSWDWYDVAHGSDKDGPKKGVPYDGALTRADGKGQWWEGYDPADLYGPHGAARTPEAFRAYVVKWFLRTRDLVDKYDPDLLYFDDSRLPLGEAGLRIAAHFYNENIRRHGGKLEAVLTTKDMPPELRKTCVWDIERGRADRLEPYPWQTDTCIGEWHYHRGIGYASADDVIKQLVDIVSKNGNLCLNIPVRGDGTIDDDEVKVLEGIAAWMDVNSEAIFGTRPWKVYGEGPAQARRRSYAAQDIRFTTKGDTLYAMALGWPANGKLAIRSLARPAGETFNSIAGVSLLGHDGKLDLSQTADGLTVTLPSRKPCEHAFTFKITGKDLRPVEVAEPVPVIQPAPDGSVTLDAESADLKGTQIRLEEIGGEPSVGFWDIAGEWLSWKVKFAGPGKFKVTALCATPHRDSEFVLEVAGQQLSGKVPTTRSFQDFQTFEVGKVDVKAAGEQVVKLRPKDAATWKAINLRTLKMSKAE